MPTAVRMRQISKRFGPVLANDHIDLEVQQGEIHALLGENGAGKTTLMNILYGLYRPDEGETWVHGERVSVGSPHEAIRLGLGMVHQHFLLVSPLTVTENIILGFRSSREPFLDTHQAERRITSFSEQYGLKVEPRAHIWQLSVGAQQRVEIIKALYRGAEILILDEPTGVLTPQEAKEFFVSLRALASQGKTIIFITHKLEEVMAVSNHITVLRDGRVVSTVKTQDTSQRELAKMMVGREVLFQLARGQACQGEVAMQVEGLRATSDRGLLALKDVTFDLHCGEILGIAGVDGNGQSELAETIVGLRKATQGRVVIQGRDVTNRSPREILDCGLAHIAEDRINMGLVSSLSVAENLILETHSSPPFAKGPFLSYREIDRQAERLVAQYGVRTSSIDAPAGLLSGGNLQKLILARELSREPRVLVAMQPTRGLDVGATEYVRKQLLEQREKGMAILLISADLDEILALSDRIAVLYEGKVMGIVPTADADIEEIGLMMAGVKDQAVDAGTGRQAP